MSNLIPLHIRTRDLQDSITEMDGVKYVCHEYTWVFDRLGETVTTWRDNPMLENGGEQFRAREVFVVGAALELTDPVLARTVRAWSEQMGTWQAMGDRRAHPEVMRRENPELWAFLCGTGPAPLSWKQAGPQDADLL